MGQSDRNDLSAFDLSRFLPYRLAVAADQVSEGLAQKYRLQFGISVAEWRVLAHLLHAGDVSVRDIERRTNMEKSKVSRAATRLEGNGYVVKRIDPSDKRLLQLSLTEAGHALMAQLVPLALEYQAEVEARLGPAFDAFDKALQALLDPSEEQDDPSA